MALTIIVTDAGRAALVNAANNGTNPVVIAQAGITATAVVPSPSATALPGEIKRISTISGDVVADDQIHLIVRDETADSYTMRSFGLYLADGTLFAIYGQSAPVVEKSAQAMMLLQVDINFADVDAAEISFGDTNFINPPATETVQGVVELATEAETTTGVDTARAVHPKGLKAAVTSWIDARFGAGNPSTFMKDLLATASAAAMRMALGLKGAALKDEGAGNGLDADLLDGQQGSYYTNIVARLGYTPWHASNDGAGSGLDADLLDGQHGAYYADVSARLGFYPVQQGGGAGQLPNKIYIGWAGTRLKAQVDSVDLGNIVTDAVLNNASLEIHGATVGRGGYAVWGPDNDGAGSGMDADLLDGVHAASFARVDLGSGATFSGGITAPYMRSTGTMDVDGNFYCKQSVAAMGIGSYARLMPDGNVRVSRAGGTSGAYYFGEADVYLWYDGANFTLSGVSGAQLYVNGGNVWTGINDGAGSGLDADMLDGLHASAFDRHTSESLTAENGYIVHANGLKECWTRIWVNADSSATFILPVAHSSWVVPTIAMSITNGENNAQQTVGVVSATTYAITIYSAVNYGQYVYIHTKGV